MLINGEPSDLVAASDRGLQYGDGLFETIAVIDGKPRLWERHMARLANGCDVLQLPPPDIELLLREAQQLCGDRSRAVLKIIITRGSGGRGYRFPEAMTPTRIVSLHPWPDYPVSYYTHGIAAALCRTRLAVNPTLAGVKHLNRLEQVLARNELGDGLQEGVMRDLDGNVIEGTAGNLFIVEEGQLVTPTLSRCGVSGVMREVVLEQARQLTIPAAIEAIDLPRLRNASECFVTNSVIGLWPLYRLDDINYSQGIVTTSLLNALRAQKLITID